jgi:hypothetical protein
MTTGDQGPHGDGDELDEPEELTEAPPESHEPLAPPPAEVDELARACIAFVKKATGMELDYTAETLPVLDFYLRGVREEAGGKTEVLALVAPPVGAYLGEVARRRLNARWYAPAGQHRRFRLELCDVLLSTNPIGAAAEALLLDEAPGWGARFRMMPEDEAVAERVLANLPEVDVEDYYAPSSRLETLEIVVDALVGHHIAKREKSGEPARRYDEQDYGWARTEAIAEAEGSGVGLA